MKYLFNEDNSDIIDRILKINNISFEELDINNFVVDKLEVLDDFVSLLLSRRDKSFLIIGDYDCDGICATAIMKKLFDDLKIKSNYYIPSRTKEGYGLNAHIVDVAKENNFDCLLMVDNGINANEHLEYANSLGIETFIIDHHEYLIPPKATGYLHPNIFPDKYAGMCAGGLTCLLSNYIREDEFSLCLGGIASMADLVSVLHYNRYLIKKMLEIISKGKIDPIQLLLSGNDVNYRSIQFVVIPKINAVSRLNDILNVNYVVRFLLSSKQECLKYYSSIETINETRKQLSKKMCAQAKDMIEEYNDFVIVKSEDFKEGLCGLVANNLLNELKKPVLVFSISDNVLKGSGRAPAGFNLYDFLYECKDLFDSYGGHAQAIGITIKEENFSKLIDFLNNSKIEIEDSYKHALLVDVNDISFKLFDDINSLKPFGIDLIEPCLAFRNPNILSKSVLAGKYAKYELTKNLSAICFNSNDINRSFEYMIGHIEVDRYNKKRLSFLIEDLL